MKKQMDFSLILALRIRNEDNSINSVDVVAESIIRCHVVIVVVPPTNAVPLVDQTITTGPTTTEVVAMMTAAVVAVAARIGTMVVTAIALRIT